VYVLIDTVGLLLDEEMLQQCLVEQHLRDVGE